MSPKHLGGKLAPNLLVHFVFEKELLSFSEPALVTVGIGLTLSEMIGVLGHDSAHAL